MITGLRWLGSAGAGHTGNLLWIISTCKKMAGQQTHVIRVLRKIPGVYIVASIAKPGSSRSSERLSQKMRWDAIKMRDGDLYPPNAHVSLCQRAKSTQH